MANVPDEGGLEHQFLPAIRRARFDQLTIFEISESELELLERGSPDSLLLSFAIALLSAAISLTAALLTATVESTRVFAVLVLITIVGYVAGIVLISLWWRTHRSVRSVVAVIRSRLPPEGAPEND